MSVKHGSIHEIVERSKNKKLLLQAELNLQMGLSNRIRLFFSINLVPFKISIKISLMVCIIAVWI